MVVIGSSRTLDDVKVRHPGHFDLDHRRIWAAASPEEAWRYAVGVASRYRGEVDDPDAQHVVHLCDEMARRIARRYGPTDVGWLLETPHGAAHE